MTGSGTGAGAGFFVGKSAAAAGAPHSPMRTTSAAAYVRICRPDPLDRPPIDAAAYRLVAQEPRFDTRQWHKREWRERQERAAAEAVA